MSLGHPFMIASCNPVLNLAPHTLSFPSKGNLYPSLFGNIVHPTKMLALSIKNEIVQVQIQKPDESYAMKEGEGPHSYSKNSIIQKGLIEGSKRLIQDAIAQGFDPTSHVGRARQICIADLGCSTGPNTFLAVQTITEAIELQFQSEGLAAQTPEFQVMFNDQVSNDFNTLFKNLPHKRNYFATGVPGCFCGRLFPRNTLHLVHSSASLCWLSKLPKEITDPNCRAWNRGRINHIGAAKEVANAYAAQYKNDLENFLCARAQELVDNGLMLLQIPVSDVVLDTDIDPGKVFELVGSCLVDMINAGLVREEKVDSFNVPLLYSPIKDVMEILEGNDSFSIERTELLHLKNTISLPSVQIFVSWFRAALQGLIEKHFGVEIVDELFNRFAEKVREYPDIMDTNKFKMAVLFVHLRKTKAL